MIGLYQFEFVPSINQFYYNFLVFLFYGHEWEFEFFEY